LISFTLSRISACHKEVLAAALKKEENERKKALTEQMEAKHKEMTEKISHIEKSERKKAEDALQATKQSYEVEIVKLKAEILDKVNDIFYLTLLFFGTYRTQSYALK
jgi:DNA-binding protein H-NS